MLLSNGITDLLKNQSKLKTRSQLPNAGDMKLSIFTHFIFGFSSILPYSACKITTTIKFNNLSKLNTKWVY